MRNLLNQWSILGLLLGILIVYSFYSSQDKQKEENNIKIKETNTLSLNKCSIEKGCSENKNLLPILDPLFNMREICKQSVLLEDHLFQTRKRCEDCVTKHALSIEALAEEAITLDKENIHSNVLQTLPDKIRNLIKKLNKCSPNEYNKIGQGFRNIRKTLMPICKNSF